MEQTPLQRALSAQREIAERETPLQRALRDLRKQNNARPSESWVSTQARATLGGLAQTGLGTLSRLAGALDVVTPSRFRSGMGPRFAQMSEDVREQLAPKNPKRRQEYDAGVVGANLASEFLKYGGAGQLAARVPQLVSRLGRTRAAATGGFGLGAVEDVGSTPEESIAALGGTAADYLGFEEAGRVLDRTAQTAGGRALVGAAAGAIPEALLGLRGRRPSVRTPDTPVSRTPDTPVSMKALPPGQYDMPGLSTGPQTRPDRLLAAPTKRLTYGAGDVLPIPEPTRGYDDPEMMEVPWEVGRPRPVRQYDAPIGPGVADDYARPGGTPTDARNERLMSFATSAPEDVVLTNPATKRQVGLAAALKRAKASPANQTATNLKIRMQRAMDAVYQGEFSDAPSLNRAMESEAFMGATPFAGAADDVLRNVEFPDAPPIPAKVLNPTGRALQTPNDPVALPVRGASEETSRERVFNNLSRRLNPADVLADTPPPATRQRMRLPQTPTAKKQQWGRSRPGQISIEALMAMARTGSGAAVGGVAGASAGETPEEKRRLALIGALTGAAGGYAIGPLTSYASRANLMNQSLDDIAKAARRTESTVSPGAARFQNMPEGITETVVDPPSRIRPARPGVRSAEDIPLSRPTTVKPAQEPLLRRLDLSPEAQDIYGPRIAAMAAEIPSESWGKLADRAARLLNTKRELLAKVNPERMTGAEGLAIASLVSENARKLEDIAKTIATTVDAPARVVLQQEFDVLDNQTNQLLSTLMQGNNAQGRALNANRVLANLTSDPAFWLLKAQRVKGDAMLTTDQKARIVDLLNGGPAQRGDLIKYLASLRESTPLEQVAQVRRADFLTALAGRIRDVVGTGVNTVALPAIRYAGSMADEVASKLVARKVGQKSTAAEFRSIAAPSTREWVEMVKGGGAGMREALQMLGADAIKKGDFKTLAEFIRAAEVDPAVMARYDIPANINFTLFGKDGVGGKISGAVDFYQKYIMRLAGATDRVFRGAAYRGAMEEQVGLATRRATAVAEREGLRGAAKEGRVQELLATAADDINANAVLASEYATFTNDGTLAKQLSAAIESIAGIAENRLKAGGLVRGLINILVPFRRTPANLVSRVIEFTPGIGTALGIKRATNWWGDVSKYALEAQAATGASKATTAAMRASQRRMIETLTANATGVGMFGLGAYLYQQGLLTGEAPRTGPEAEQWRTEGRQANSLLIGDRWYPIGQLAPLGNVLSITANYFQNKDADVGALDMAAGFSMDAARTALNQPLLTGPREALEAMTSDPAERRQREGYARNMAGSFVPGILAAIARMDGRARQPLTMGESIRSRIPGLADDIPARINVFGEPVTRAEGLLVPMTKDRRAMDPLVREMARVGAQVGAVSKKRDESPAMFRWRQSEAGKWVRQGMEELVNTSEYRAAPVEEQRDMLKEVAESERRAFTKYIREAYGIGATPR